MIAKAGKPFTEGEFIKECMLQAASIVCPEKRAQLGKIKITFFSEEFMFIITVHAL